MAIYIKLATRRIATINYHTMMSNNQKYKMITHIGMPSDYSNTRTLDRLLKNLCDLANSEHYIMFCYIMPSRYLSRNDIIKIMEKHGFNLINKQTMCRCTIPNISKEQLNKVLENYEMEE